MGANASILPVEHDGRRPKLEDIPESCIALVLSYFDPPEIAKLARLSRAFRAASSADFIWVPKLPSTYPYILSKLSDQGGVGDKGQEGRLMAIFQTIAYLQQIWWLEVDGNLEFPFPPGTYSLFFRLQLGRACKRLGRRACNSDNVHGWDIKPAQFQLKTQDGQHAVSRYMLGNLGTWVHYHVGDFVVEDPNSLANLKFSLTQIDCTHTKGGLCVDSVLICPSSLGKELFSSVDVQVCKKL
ncbi:UNVERIFIED_CONTAM: F-box protein PP2-A13 [Sesamum radiatum]|uniref:F-box protein PP2-A13 n=1 Tax=Sesamum radiatum TaxID=300843 RepID=A0AAW2R0P6_SESRA